MVRIYRDLGEEEREEEEKEAAERQGDVTSNRQPMRVREGERAARGGCVFLSLQHQHRTGAQSI